MRYISTEKIPVDPITTSQLIKKKAATTTPEWKETSTRLYQDLLLKLGLILLLRASPGFWDPSVGGAIENMEAVMGASTKSRPALCVIVVAIRKFHGCGGNVILEGAEVVEELGDSCCAIHIDCESVSQYVCMYVLLILTCSGI